MEGLKIDDKPTVPVVPNITVPTVPTVPQQPFNLYDPKLPANYQNMPQQPPQNMQYPGYTYYPYGPMQMPMMPTGYVMPQYPTNGQYPAGGYAYTQKPPVQPNQQPSANPSKQITGDNLYNIASKWNEWVMCSWLDLIFISIRKHKKRKAKWLQKKNHVIENQRNLF